MIFGVGAQGTAVAMRMNEHPSVDKIIYVDIDERAVNYVAQRLSKAIGVVMDADDAKQIKRWAKKADLLVNGLPTRYNKNILDMAVDVGVDYQDFAAADYLADSWSESFEILYNDYGAKFAKKGKIALVGTGSSPGLICLATRKAVALLDSCDSILNLVYEGVDAKRGIPFWFSPANAIADMCEMAYIVKDGVLLEAEPFTSKIERVYACIGKKPLRFSNHCHDEPLHYWFNRDSFFKGAKNIAFKYGGVGMDFSEPLYRSGELSDKAVYINGKQITPFDILKDRLPCAPKYDEEIESILQEGLRSDFTLMAVEACGKINGVDRMVETVILSPGLAQSYERAGITSEMFVTGQSAALFTELLVERKFNEKGVISSDMISDANIEIIISRAEELGIEIITRIKDPESCLNRGE